MTRVDSRNTYLANDMEDRIIRARIPFLKAKTVMFIPGGPTPYSGLPEWYFELFHSQFRRVGHKFLYLPEMFKQITPEMMEYVLPGYERDLLYEAYGQIWRRTNLFGEEGFLYKQGRIVHFHPIADRSPDGVEKSVESLTEILVAQQKTTPRRFLCEYDYAPKAKVLCSVDFEESGMIRIPEEDPDGLSPWALEALDRWDEIERKYGVTIDQMYLLVKGRVKPSRLSISLQNEIQLIDWPGSPVVKMDDLSKTLYFFFLKHPEGAVLKQLDQFREELLEIYTGMTGREDMDAVFDTIARVTDPFYSGRDALMSRIRKAFRDIVGDPIAKKYYVNGKAGDVYTISLDRDYVIWEH